MYTLDETDRRILLELDHDPRMTVLLLAQRTGLARGTVQARLSATAPKAAPAGEHARAAGRAGARPDATVAAELDQHSLEAAIEGLEEDP